MMGNDLTVQNTTPKAKAKWPFVLLAVIISLPVLLWGITILVEKKVKAEIISMVNEQVIVPVEVTGGIELSLFRHFPYASVTFRDVSIDDRLQKGKKVLLRVEELSFLCHLYTLFGDKIEVKKIYSANGELNIYYNSKGESNLNILMPDNGSSSNLAVQLKNAELRSMKLTYKNLVQNVSAGVNIDKALLKGNFYSGSFDLDAFAKLKVHQINLGDDRLLDNKQLKLDLGLFVDKHNKKYQIRRGSLSVDETEFIVTGLMATLKSGTKVDFELKNKGDDMRKLFALLPEKYKASFADAEGSGAYAVEAKINGIASSTSQPGVEVKANLINSELKFGRYNKFLKSVNATASYSLNKEGIDKLVISNFNCTLNEQPFHFSLVLDNLSDPFFNFAADGTLHLTEIVSFIPDTVLTDLEGVVYFNQFKLSGRKTDFSSVENSTLKGSGIFELKEVEFRQNGVTYGNINGLLSYAEHTIEAKNFTLNFLSTDFTFNGTIHHLPAFIYNLSSKRKANDVVLGVNGSVKIQTFNLTSILDTYDKKNKPTAMAREKLNVAEVMNMSGNLDVEVNRFLFRKMKFENLKAQLQLSPGIIRIHQLKANAMGGDLRAAGLITFDSGLQMECDIQATGLDIPTIFNQCENFGQNTLTNKHLKGTVSSAVSFNARWNNYKTLDENTLSAIVDFQIKNGELIDFEPLRAASKFIRLEELKRIRFQDLNNTIRIANRKLDLPEFEIKTSALNLIIYGTHWFNNDIDYHFKINLHKLLANRFQRNTQNESFIEDDPYQGLNIYMTMTGNLSNPVIKYDKPSVRNKIKEDFRKERENMKALLNNRALPKDENEQKREDKYFNTEETPQFMDFDEEKP